MNGLMEDIKTFIKVRHENLKTVWANSDDLQQRAMLTAAVYGGIVMTIACGLASIIF